MQLIDGRDRLVEVQQSKLMADPPVEHDKAQGASLQEFRFFTLFLQRYIYSAEEDTFVAVPAMPAHLPSHVCQALDVLHSLDQGQLLTLKLHSMMCIIAALTIIDQHPHHALLSVFTRSSHHCVTPHHCPTTDVHICGL